MKKLFMLLFLLSSKVSAANSIEVQLNSQKDGYVGDLSFQYGINNCYGAISLAFGNESLKASGYVYQSKAYSASELGLTDFKKNKPMGLNISADVFDSERNLGRVEFKNVIFYSGVGCFSETYPLVEMLGLKNSDFKESYKNLSLRNASVSGSIRNYKIEDIIIKMQQTQESAEKKVRKAGPIPSQEKVSGEARSVPGKESLPPKSQLVENSRSQKMPPKQNIEQAMAAQQGQFETTQEQVREGTQKVTSAAGGFASGISGTGDGAGMSFLTDNANDSKSPFSPLFLGLVFGKAHDPTLEENTNNFLSAVQIQAAFNTEWLGSDPETYSTNKYPQNNRRWEILLEGKFFTNFSALGAIQPYLALGYASYTDFDRQNKSAGTGWEVTTGYGIGFVGAHGMFNIGINQNIKALDISFIFHQ